MPRPHLTPTDPIKPRNYSHLPPGVRLEMLIGYFADALGPAKDLAEAFRLQANASVTTRAKLDTLIDLASVMYSELRAIRAHVDLMKKEEDERGAADV